MKKSILIAMFFIFVLSSFGFAATYYVDKAKSNANDSNPGTASAPFKTIQKAVNVAKAGDVVLVKYGVYSERISMQRSGTSTSRIRISAFDLNNRPVIDGTNVAADQLIYWGSTPKNFITFEGFEVRNARKWAVWVTGNSNIIRNNKVHRIPRSGITVYGGNSNLIARNEVFNIGNVSLGIEGNSIDIEAVPAKGWTANYNIVEHNKIYANASHFGVNIFPETQGSQVQMSGNIIRFNKIDKCLGGIYTRYQTNFEIHNNIITNSIDNGIWFHINSKAPLSANTYTANGKIFNNTVIGSTNVGLFNSTSNGLQIINNIFVDNGITATGGAEHIRMDKLTGHSIKNNLYFGKGAWKWNNVVYKTYNEWKAKSNDLYSIVKDPRFVNRASQDFRLSSGSGAVDAGSSLTSYKIDISGVTRPKGLRFDIGAHESSFLAKEGEEELGEELTDSNLPTEFDLSQNYPNPFNPSTKIKYALPEMTEVKVKIYDILGAEVATLVNAVQAPGFYEIDFNGANLASGAYVYRIETQQFVLTKKMMLLK